MASNPYEMRWELLQRAEDRLINRYQAQADRYNILLEKGEDPGDFPEYPSDFDIHQLAKTMNSFISGGSDA